MLRPPRQRESQLRTWPVVSPCRVWVTLFLAALPWGGAGHSQATRAVCFLLGHVWRWHTALIGGSLALDVACLGSHLGSIHVERDRAVFTATQTQDHPKGQRLPWSPVRAAQLQAPGPGGWDSCTWAPSEGGGLWRPSAQK